MAEPVGFREYVVARHAALLRTAWLLTGDVSRAEDLVQVALMKAWRRWSVLGADPDAYIRKIMVNTRVSWSRRSWNVEKPSGALPERPTEDQADAVEVRDTVMALLASLPRRQRAVVVLRYYEDLSERQVADLLGCSIGTVKSHASRGLAALRLARLPTEATPKATDT
jgi:RNA polymerase sigma-70 factor (sigma-E family)